MLTLRAASTEIGVFDEGEVEVDGVTVLERPIRKYSDIGTATRDLLAVLERGESVKVQAARIVKAIRDGELYRELGFTSFKDYRPALLQVLEGVGWGSARTLDNYLALLDVYVAQLAFFEERTFGASTHLIELLRLADRDRASGELKDDVKEGKLPSFEFHALTEVIAFLVSQPAEVARVGLSVEEAKEALAKDGLGPEGETFERLAGRPPRLPAGGWSVEDTKEIIERLSGKEKIEKLGRVWVAAQLEAGEVALSGVEFYEAEHLTRTLNLGGEIVSGEEFERMVGGDKKRYVNKEG